MASFSLFTLILALRFFFLVSSAPAPLSVSLSASVSVDASTSTSSYWLANINRNGVVAYGDSSYQIFRNVKNFGAVGDGVTDDTAVSHGKKYFEDFFLIKFLTGYQLGHFFW